MTEERMNIKNLSRIVVEKYPGITQRGICEKIAETMESVGLGEYNPVNFKEAVKFGIREWKRAGEIVEGPHNSNTGECRDDAKAYYSIGGEYV